MVLPSRLGCPLSLKTANMGNVGAKKCGVSEKMAQYRLDVTGVVRQNQAFLRKRRARR